MIEEQPSFSKETFPVRPFGKFGQTYRLTKRLHWAYQLVSALICFVVLALGLLGIIGPKLAIDWLWIPSPLVVLVATLFEVCAAIAIATRGEVVGRSEHDRGIHQIGRQY
jgi:hypothetical protein